MPMPEPKKGESQKDFIERCMADRVMNEEYPEADQRRAVCQSQWDGKDEKRRSGRAVLGQSVTRFRAPIVRGIQALKPVERRGGDEGAGLIRQASIISRGEADGHDLWIDHTFLGQVADAINGMPAGVKVRFTHPGLSGDGLGKFLGRAKHADVADGRVLADVHLSPTAHKTPDGDLASYVMDLAEADAAAFGMSISYYRDKKAEENFRDEQGERSPDEKNVHNYPHSRLKKLFAADVVDDPAANPKGLFHRGQAIAQEADALLSFSVGLTRDVPELVELDVDPARVSGFVGRFLDQHGLEIVHKDKEADMSKSATTEAATETLEGLNPDELRQEGAARERKRFAGLAERFDDAAFVVEQFKAGHDADEALGIWDQRELARMKAENERLASENEALKKRPAPDSTGPDAVSFDDSDESSDGGDFMAVSKARAKADGCKLHEAMSKIAREQPELHAAYVEASRARPPRTKR